jgi:hypothetical protein
MRFVRVAPVSAALLLVGPHSAAQSMFLKPSVAIQTTAPLDIGARLDVELPARVRVFGSIGYLPPPYSALITDVVVLAGGYTEQQGEIVRQGLDSSVVGRVGAGYRVLPNYDLFVDVGYSLVTLGGGFTGEEVLALATGVDPPEVDGGERAYSVSSTLHLAFIDVGYEFFISRHVFLRASLGFAGALAASTTVEADAPEPNQYARFAGAAGDYLDELYTSYVFLPTLGIAVGHRFLSTPSQD